MSHFRSSASSPGAVAAGHQVTATAAVEILRAGGNAFDAAIAAVWAACVCEPVFSAPAGGGFLMADDGEKSILFDFFCDTPRTGKPADAIEFVEVFADFGTLKQPFHIGAGSVATPGMIPGLFAVSAQLGSLPMADLVAPAIRAASEGVPVTAFQAHLYEVVDPILTWTTQAQGLFAPGGPVLKAGDRLTNPQLADTLAAIARGENDVLASEIVAESTRYGGHLTHADLADYRVCRRDPIRLAAGNSTILLNPPPSMGGMMVGAMLNHWQQAVHLSGDCGVARAGAMKAVDDAWRNCGPALGENFGLNTVTEPAPVVTRGTTHISVIDGHGRAAAVTVSNGEGNGRILPGHGFMLNNMLGEENLNPDGFHNWQPGVRLASMMAPTIARDDRGGLTVLGSGGANRIRTAIFQAIASAVSDAGATDAGAPEAIVTAPRLHFENGILDIECPREWADIDALRNAWPDAIDWPQRSLYFGGVHMVDKDAEGTFRGAGDPRRDGVFCIA
ncbi:MAG: gamma-glutamyltransferase [Alphaproteobacteria bacterium]